MFCCIERRLPSKKDTRGKETETDGRPTTPLARKKISLDAGSPLPKRLYTSTPSRFDVPDEIDSVNSVDLTNEVAASPSNISQSKITTRALFKGSDRQCRSNY